MKLSYKDMSEERRKYRLNLIHAVSNWISINIIFIDENLKHSSKYIITKIDFDGDNIVVSYNDNGKPITQNIPLNHTWKNNILISIDQN
jgi:hypothetical protein